MGARRLLYPWGSAMFPPDETGAECHIPLKYLDSIRTTETNFTEDAEARIQDF